VAHELGRQSRLLHIWKTRMAAWAPAGMDWAAFGLLMTLVKCGPCRQSELADVTMLDPSTVSRHVGQLVKHGMVARQPDPDDGRAVRLIATDAGEAMAKELLTRREEMFHGILGDWSEEDAAALLALMRRLNDGLEKGLDLEPAPPRHDP
jgi:DNA-binding MarR family transcriptional regulator